MISIIVPVYNSSMYIDRCIQSVLKQTISRFELILINDASDDDSLEICKEWEKKDCRIRIIDQRINAGVSRTRNIGLQSAIGDYVFLLDSDDWLAENAIEVLIVKLKETQSDCVICGLNQSSGTVWAPREDKTYDSFMQFHSDFPYWINTELLSCSVNKLYKRELIKLYYPENMSFAEDLVFCLHYLQNCNRITFIQNPLYQHDVSNNTSLTHTFDIRRFADVELMQDAILDFYGSDSKNVQLLNRKYIKDIIDVIRNYVKSPNYSFKSKTIKLQEWYKDSHLKSIPISGDMSMKNRVIMTLLKLKQYRLLDLIWNN